MSKPLCALLLLLAIPAAAAVAAGPDDLLERLASLLAGSISSAEQAAADKNHRNVVLHAVRIWPDRTDGPWLYAQQAPADAVDQPYRQRVHQLARRPDGSFESRVFTLADPVAATGPWRKPAPLADLTLAALTSRDGCTVFLHPKPDGSFVGRTEGKGCASELRGAAYATSEITLTPAEIVSWDRGFNSSDKQVWGAPIGGYRFKRLTVP